MHLVGDRLALMLRHVHDGDCSDAAMAAMGPHLDLKVDASFRERCENAGEYAFGGIPPELRLEHFPDAGKWHWIDRDNLHRSGGALRRSLTDPGF